MVFNGLKCLRLLFILSDRLSYLYLLTGKQYLLTISPCNLRSENIENRESYLILIEDGGYSCVSVYTNYV